MLELTGLKCVNRFEQFYGVDIKELMFHIYLYTYIQYVDIFLQFQEMSELVDVEAVESELNLIENICRFIQRIFFFL